MTAVHASFPIRYEHRAGARDCPVLEERYDSVRSDIVVDLPVRQDRHRGSLHGGVILYEKIWVDPVCAVTETYDVDYSSGLASCLAVRFDVEQSYMGGSETWLGSFQTDFADGKAVCLWQSFEVVQDYLGGTEVWPGSHDQCFALGRAVCLWQSFEVVQGYLGGTEAWLGSYQVDFALGRAVCLRQVFEIVQDYVGGNEAWTSSYGQDFALGKAVCLYQAYRIDQPYVGGVEEWPSMHEGFFSSGRGDVLSQGIDVVQPYTGGREDWTFRFDRCSPSVSAQMFLVGTETTEIAGRGMAVIDSYEIKKIVTDGTVFGLDSIADASYFDVFFSRNCHVYSHYLAMATTGPVMIDTLSGRPRNVEFVSIFAVPETSSLELLGRYDFTEYASACTYYAFDRQNAGRVLLWLQEEAWFEYSAFLTDIHKGLVSVVVTSDLEEAVKNLEQRCIGDGQWQMEYETTVRFYKPDRPDQRRDPVLWRFLTADGKHWKEGPVVSDVRAVRLPSFLELHFMADWPYRAFELQINARQFQPTEDGDWFDLGVWISDSVRIDTDERPLLTIPYVSGTTSYDVHVPRQETTRYIGIAPIRRFPYEEVGALSVIFVP